jgi:hypothetical protein
MEIRIFNKGEDKWVTVAVTTETVFISSGNKKLYIESNEEESEFKVTCFPSMNIVPLDGISIKMK